MEHQVRAALYARISSEEQVEGYSLDAQKRAFEALVQGRGWVVHVKGGVKVYQRGGAKLYHGTLQRE